MLTVVGQLSLLSFIFIIPIIISLHHSLINLFTSIISIIKFNIQLLIINISSLSFITLSINLSHYYLISKNCNHKRIGIYYLLASILFIITGLLFSIFIRLELLSSGSRIIFLSNVNFYNLIITLHGLIMIFFVIMPGLFGGFGNYLIPIYFGVPEILFPRINNFALFLVYIAFIIVFKSIIIEYSIGVGWTLYPPLSVISTVIINLILISLIVSGVSSLLSSLNFLLLVFISYVFLYNLFSWSIIITAIMLIFTLPILTGVIIMLLSDLYFNSIFFIIVGDPILYQHLFWYFGHPEVYILILPAFGIISQIISNLSQKIIFGNNSMILAMICISIFGSIVWGHHIYVVGLEIETKIYFTNVTLIISLPTGTKIYNWLSIYLGLLISTRLLSLSLAIIFVLVFTIGGVTGIILGNDIVDLTLHDSYYVVAHFHFILSIGAIISLLAGLIFMKELLFSSFLRFYIIKLNRYYFILIFISINFIFIPLFYNIMPRRILEFPDFINS